MISREQAKELFRNDRDAYGKPRAIMSKIDKIYDSIEEHNNEKLDEFEKIATEYLKIKCMYNVEEHNKVIINELKNWIYKNIYGQIK